MLLTWSQRQHQGFYLNSEEQIQGCLGVIRNFKKNIFYLKIFFIFKKLKKNLNFFKNIFKIT